MLRSFLVTLALAAVANAFQPLTSAPRRLVITRALKEPRSTSTSSSTDLSSDMLNELMAEAQAQDHKFGRKSQSKSVVAEEEPISKWKEFQLAARKANTERKIAQGEMAQAGFSRADGRWLFFGWVPAIIGAFFIQIIGNDWQMWMELPIYSSALVGVMISIGWFAAENRGVAFFSKERGAGQMVGVDGEGRTGIIPPLA